MESKIFKNLIAKPHFSLELVKDNAILQNYFSCLFSFSWSDSPLNSASLSANLSRRNNMIHNQGKIFQYRAYFINNRFIHEVRVIYFCGYCCSSDCGFCSKRMIGLSSFA